MRKTFNKKNDNKSLYDLTESDLEILLEASIKYDNDLKAYDKCCKECKLAEQNAQNRFESEAKQINDRVLYLSNQYNVLLKNLSKYRVGFIQSMLKDTFKYKTHNYVDIMWNNPTSRLLNVVLDDISNGGCSTESHTYLIDAKSITNAMDKITSEYLKLKNARDELKIKIFKTMVPQKPDRPQLPKLSAWLNSYFNLSECTPTKIRHVMVQTNQSQDLKAKATAYDNKQRQEAGTIKRKIVNQIHLFPFCPYCGDNLPENDAHADHIYPVSKGGQSTIRNMVFVCTKCNLKKRDLTLRNFIAKYDLNGDFIHKNLDILGKDF